MSHAVASSAPITSAHTVKQYAGFGILGADIPATGDNGGSPVLNDSIVSTSEHYWRLETAPSSGMVTLYPDLSFEHTGAADGVWPWVYRLYWANIDGSYGNGTATVTDTFGSTSAVTADASASYVIRGVVSTDIAPAYPIRAAVQKDLAAIFNVRSSVSADRSAAYDIQSASSVATGFTGSYIIRGAAQSDCAASYAVLGAVQADCSTAYSVRSSASRDLAAAYSVESAIIAVHADFSANYAIYGVASQCPTADEIAAAVWQRVLEGGLSAEAMQRIQLAALVGETSGVGSTSETYLAQDGTTARVVADFDASNNRTSVTLNGAV